MTQRTQNNEFSNVTMTQRTQNNERDLVNLDDHKLRNNIKFHEKHEKLVQIMIEYFYTIKYFNSNLNNNIMMKQKNRRDYTDDFKCLFNFNDCCLKFFDIEITMHVLNDKYNISNLKKHFCN